MSKLNQLFVHPYYEQLKTLHEMEIKEITDYYHDLVNSHGLDPRVAQRSLLEDVAPINKHYAEILAELPFPMFVMREVK